MEVYMKPTTKASVTALRKRQQVYVQQGNLRTYEQRMTQLKTLKTAIMTYEDRLFDALRKDLKKSNFEIMFTEIAFVIQELNDHLKHLRRWMRPKKVKTNLLTQPAKSYIVYEPYGSVLVISPWNYPFQLAMVPVIGALSAGNSVVIKPSEHAPYTSQVIEDMIEDFFDESVVAVVQGEVKETTWLLDEPFDYIFFTGSPKVGSIVMKAASKYLTPLTLELGGKSPCIVDETVDVSDAAKKIIFGKTINAGQTCIAPDYLIVKESIKPQLVQAMKMALLEMYGENSSNEFYGGIIHERHFDRLEALLKDTKILVKGKINKKKLHFPLHIIDAPKEDHPIHHEEIFGPILPIYTYQNDEEIEQLVRQEANPLAMYIFSNNKRFRDELVQTIPAGGVCLNDTIFHIVNPHLPFGGRGRSGNGAYHGVHSFLTYSHQKSVLQKSSHFDLSQKYPPYSPKIYNTFKKFLMR